MTLKNKILRSLNQLITKDFHLLRVDANERAITHRLALYLETEFPEYHIDCEYNRNNADQKRLMTFRQNIESDNTNGVTVFPDIIVHRRGTNINFIVIEAKKHGHGSAHVDVVECKCDRCKLKSYKNDLNYEYAFFIQFPTGDEVEHINSQLLVNLIEEI